MKVYLVQEHDYDYAEVLGTFWTLRAAKAAIDALPEARAINADIMVLPVESTEPADRISKMHYSMPLEPLWTDDPTRVQREEEVRERWIAAGRPKPSACGADGRVEA